MTPEIIGGIARSVLAALGGILIGKGAIDAETWATVSGAVVTLAVTGWSVWAKRAA